MGWGVVGPLGVKVWEIYTQTEVKLSVSNERRSVLGVAAGRNGAKSPSHPHPLPPSIGSNNPHPYPQRLGDIKCC